MDINFKVFTCSPFPLPPASSPSVRTTYRYLGYYLVWLRYINGSPEKTSEREWGREGKGREMVFFYELRLPTNLEGKGNGQHRFPILASPSPFSFPFSVTKATNTTNTEKL